MKGKTCCYVHQYLEDTPAEPDYFMELAANLRFVLRNQAHFEYQEKRVAMFAVCDKFVDDPKKLYSHELVRWWWRAPLPAVERYLLANGHGPIDPSHIDR